MESIGIQGSINRNGKQNRRRNQGDLTMYASKQEIVQDYLAAYVAAESADLKFSQALRVQFGGNATRWHHAGKFYSPETRAAFWAKVNADHEVARLLYIMREAGVSLADYNPTEVV